MRIKVLFILFIIGLASSHAQRGVRIGYIDTEYILENVPEYQEATNQLNKKVQKWKTDIEKQLKIVENKKTQLENERILLTKELYEERLEDISYEEAEIIDYQQDRFGPSGDLMIQKQQLMQPVQDQIFAAVQEIAGNKKYDFIFDKSADVVMLYSAERFDISEMVIRSITRSSKRTQAQSRAERKAAEEEEVVPEINEELEAREKEQAEKLAEREKAIEERKSLQQKRRDSLKDAAAARRQKILDERAAAKAERDSIKAAKSGSTDSNNASAELNVDDKKEGSTVAKTPEEIAEEKRQAKLKDRAERKKALEERKRKILEARKKAKEEREAKKAEQDSVPNNN